MKPQLMHAFNRSSYSRTILLIAACIIISTALSCQDKKQVERWDIVNIDPQISGHSVYKRLDKENELFSAHEKQDSSIKRSSDVAYTKTGKDITPNINYLKFNNCRSFFFHSDTLTINIGIGDGLGGQGFVIRYKNNKFYTEPYFITDVIVRGEPSSTYELEYQRLTLNKSGYKIGDSLYGRIDFKSIETRKRERIIHTGNGYFRTRVSTLNN